MATCTLWDFGIRQNFVTFGDRNFETSGTVQYDSAVENLYFNGSHYNIGQALPFDVGGVSYSPQAVSVLNLYWNNLLIKPTV